MIYAIIFGLIAFGLALFGLIFLVVFSVISGMWYIALLPVTTSVVVLIIGFRKMKSKYDLSPRDRARIDRAAREDREAQEKYQRELNAAKSAARARFSAESDQINGEIAALKQQLAQKQRELHAMNCLHDDDKFPKCVEFLIYRLETGRADSIKEALNQYDAERKEEDRREQQRWQWEMDRLQRQFDAERRAQQEHEDTLRYYEERNHRERMEELERKRLEEVQELNRKLNK